MKSIVDRFFSKKMELDLQDPIFYIDPYKAYSYLRKNEPLYETKSGAWLISGYDAVLASLTDERLGNSPSDYALVNERNKEKYKAAEVACNILPFLDSPKHDVIRRNVILAYRESFMAMQLDLESIASAIWEKLHDKKEFEFISEFATPFAMEVMTKIFALPSSDHSLLEKWCENFFYLFMPIRSKKELKDLENSLHEFREYLREKVRTREDVNAIDLLSKLKHSKSNGESLSEDQIIDNAMLLFADGIENVDRGLANAVLCLLNHPKELDKFKKNPSLLSSLADECLRYESPAQYIGRIAKEDIIIAGKMIKKNRLVVLLLASANRDEAIFQNADQFQIDRSPNKHLSFGRTKHSCIGGGLVKQEMMAVLKVISFSEGGIKKNYSKLEWLDRPGHRWLKELQIKK